MSTLGAVLRNRRVLLSVGVMAVILAAALWPETIAVETATIGRGPLVVTIDEEGRTRVRERYVVAAPVGGRILRLDLEPGDRVEKGATVARVHAEAAPLLDARSRAEAQAASDAATAALGRARADEQRARTAAEQARRELQRTSDLAVNELTTKRELDARTTDVRAADEALRAAEFAVRAAASEVTRSRARLAPSNPDLLGRVLPVVSPVSGVVLKRLRESESVVPAGEPLIEIGDPRRLEIIADLLSTDAVRVPASARAIVEQWGGPRPLDARVRRVEPSGFTKVSALGVEEQRVNAVLDLLDPAAASALGDGFRVEVRIVVSESADVLKVPTNALFRVGDRWAVYRVDGNRARQTFVRLDHQNADEAEVLEGLSVNDRVVLYPGDRLSDGARIR
jgi:HlyD family secretion protein